MGSKATDRNTKVIVITSLKGGVAKTTNTLHMAAALAELGFDASEIDALVTDGVVPDGPTS